jgi:protein MpaA
MLAALPENPPAARAPAWRHTEVLGESVRGRTIRAIVVGDRAAPRRVLVVGCIHGDECAGVAVARRLEAAPPPAGTAIWVVPQLNPDGAARGSRLNARGVDLNRNFPAGWSARAASPGPRPLSEPETRIARALVVRVRPAVTIWFHQAQRMVRAWGPSVLAARRYARLARLRYRSLRWPPGSAARWQNTRFPHTASFVVELAAGALSEERVARHVAAIRTLGS